MSHSTTAGHGHGHNNNSHASKHAPPTSASTGHAQQLTEHLIHEDTCLKLDSHSPSYSFPDYVGCAKFIVEWSSRSKILCDLKLQVYCYDERVCTVFLCMMCPMVLCMYVRVVGLLFLPDEIVIGSWSCCTVCHIRALDIFASLAASIIGDYIDEYMLLDL
jgi:hypothetical protein